MNNSSFVITLPSNVINDYHNRSNCYRTNLPCDINLSGDWEVAVGELFLTVSQFNVDNGTLRDRQIIFKNKNGDGNIAFLVITISAGHYSTLADLISEINREVQEVIPDTCKFSIDSITQRSIISLNNTSNLTLFYIGKEIAYILGFELETEILFSAKGQAVSSSACDISANLNQVYIYTNIIQNCVVGNSMSKLIKIVNISKGSFGQSLHFEFSRPQYHTLVNKHFNEIEIELRSGSGQLFPFHFGNTIVQLVFKRKGLRL